MSDNRKNIIIRADQELHQKIRIHVAMNNTTIQEYIVNLIKEDLEKNEKTNRSRKIWEKQNSETKQTKDLLL